MILGAGLDSFAQRRAEVAERMTVFEVDQPGPQAWKRRRLAELGFSVPARLRFVPASFEAGGSWWDELCSAGFDAGRPAVVSSTGVAMYLTREAIAATLARVAALAPGSVLVVTFVLRPELCEPEERAALEWAEKGARERGTPFVSFFAPAEMLELAREAGFKDARCVSGATLAERYFAGRGDGLRPGSAETLLVART